ncbi:MAG: cation diffusion facilitator family transporter [Arenimonas sp.]
MAGHSQHDHDHASPGHDHHGDDPQRFGHDHAPTSFGHAFALGTALNVGFVLAETWYGLAAHSMALLSDAAHNFADASGLLLAWGAAHLATRQPTRTRTYGWGRSTILASLINAVVLLVGCGGIAWEAVQRFGDTRAVASTTVMWVAALGIVINGATALLFMRGRHTDLNVRGAYLHMAADAAVSAGVVVSALLIGATGWSWIDPAASLAIVVVIVAGTWSLLRDSFGLAMDHVPAGIDLADVESAFLALPGVVEVHDLHIWALSTTEIALTAHLVQDGSADSHALIGLASELARQRFRIGHSTIQVEALASAEGCGQRAAASL